MKNRMVCYIRERERSTDSKMIGNLFQIYSETEGDVQAKHHAGAI